MLAQLNDVVAKCSIEITDLGKNLYIRKVGLMGKKVMHFIQDIT